MLNITFDVWFVKEDCTKAKRGIMVDIKERFDAEGIEIPFPHRTIYTGSVTEPFPVRVTERMDNRESKGKEQ